MFSSLPRTVQIDVIPAGLACISMQMHALMQGMAPCKRMQKHETNSNMLLSFRNVEAHKQSRKSARMLKRSTLFAKMYFSLQFAHLAETTQATNSQPPTRFELPTPHKQTTHPTLQAKSRTSKDSIQIQTYSLSDRIRHRSQQPSQTVVRVNRGHFCVDAIFLNLREFALGYVLSMQIHASHALPESMHLHANPCIETQHVPQLVFRVRLIDRLHA